MDIFLSWSGKKSKAIAKALEEWLPVVIQSINPFFSDQSIETGERWAKRIASELSTSNYGIICLTHDNINAPWIQFEAGALSKISTKSNVSILLFDINPSDLVKNPLGQFQAIGPSRDDIFKLLESINCKVQNPIPQERLVRIYEKNWPDLEAEFGKILSQTKTNRKVPEPSEKELLQYMLEKQELFHTDISRIIERTNMKYHPQFSLTEQRLLEAIREERFKSAHTILDRLAASNSRRGYQWVDGRTEELTDTVKKRGQISLADKRKE